MSGVINYISDDNFWDQFEKSQIINPDSFITIYLTKNPIIFLQTGKELQKYKLFNSHS